MQDIQVQIAYIFPKWKMYICEYFQILFILEANKSYLWASLYIKDRKLTKMRPEIKDDVPVSAT